MYDDQAKDELRQAMASHEEGIVCCQSQTCLGQEARFDQPVVDVLCRSAIKSLVIKAKHVNLYLDSADMGCLDVTASQSLTIYLLNTSKVRDKLTCHTKCFTGQYLDGVSTHQLDVKDLNFKYTEQMLLGFPIECQVINGEVNAGILLSPLLVGERGALQFNTLDQHHDMLIRNTRFTIKSKWSQSAGCFYALDHCVVDVAECAFLLAQIDSRDSVWEVEKDFFIQGGASFSRSELTVRGNTLGENLSFQLASTVALGRTVLDGPLDVAQSTVHVDDLDGVAGASLTLDCSGATLPCVNMRRDTKVDVRSSAPVGEAWVIGGELVTDCHSDMKDIKSLSTQSSATIHMHKDYKDHFEQWHAQGNWDLHDHGMDVHVLKACFLQADMRHLSYIKLEADTIFKSLEVVIDAKDVHLVARRIAWHSNRDETISRASIWKATEDISVSAGDHLDFAGTATSENGSVLMRADGQCHVSGHIKAKKIVHIEGEVGICQGKEGKCEGQVVEFHSPNGKVEQHGELFGDDHVELRGLNGLQARTATTQSGKTLHLYFDGTFEKYGCNTAAVIDEIAWLIEGYGGRDYAEIIHSVFFLDLSVMVQFYNQGLRLGLFGLNMAIPNIPNFEYVSIMQMFFSISRMGMGYMLADMMLPIIAMESVLTLCCSIGELGKDLEIIFDDAAAVHEKLRAVGHVVMLAQGALLTASVIRDWYRGPAESRLAAHLENDTTPTDDPIPQEVMDGKQKAVEAKKLAEAERQKALESGKALPKSNASAEPDVSDLGSVEKMETPPAFSYGQFAIDTWNAYGMTAMHLAALGLGARTNISLFSFGLVDIGVNTTDFSLIGGSVIKAGFNQNITSWFQMNLGFLAAGQQSLQTCYLYDCRWSSHHVNRGYAWIGHYDQHGVLVWKHGVYEIDHHQGFGSIDLDDAIIVGDSTTTGPLTISGLGGIVGDYVTQAGVLNVVSKDGKPSTAIIHGSKKCEPIGHGDAQGQIVVFSGHLVNAMANVIGQDRYDVTGGKRCVHTDQPFDLFAVKLPGTYDLEVVMPKGRIGQFWNPGHKVHVVTTQGDLIEEGRVVASEFLADSARYIIKRTLVWICVDGDAHEHAAKGIYGVGVEHFAGGKFYLSCDEGNIVIQGFEGTYHHPECGEVTYYFPFKLQGGLKGPVDGPATMIMAPEGVVVLNHVQIKAWHDGQNVIMAKAIYGLPKYSPYTLGIAWGSDGEAMETRQAMSEGLNRIAGKENVLIATDGMVGLVGTITEGETRSIATKGVIHVSTTGTLQHQSRWNHLWGAGQEIVNTTEEVLVGMRHENGALILQTDEGSVVISDRIDTGEEALVMITKDPNGRLIIAKHVLTTNTEVSRHGLFIHIPWPTLDLLPLKDALAYLAAASDWVERLCAVVGLGIEGYNTLDGLSKAYKAYWDGSLSEEILQQVGMPSFGLLYEDTRAEGSSQKVSEGGVKCGAFYAKGPMLEYLNGADFSAAVSHMEVDCIRIQPAKLTMQASKEGYSVELRIAPTDDPATFAIKGLTLTNHKGATHEVCYQGGVIQPGILFLKDGSTVENEGGLLQPALVSGKDVNLTFRTPQDTLTQREKGRSISISFLENGKYASSVGGSGDTQDAKLSRCTAAMVITGVDPEVFKELGQEFVFESSSKTQSAVFSNQAEGQQHWSDCNENTNNHDSHEGMAYGYQANPGDVQRLNGQVADGPPIATWPVQVAPTHYQADVRTVISGVELNSQGGDPVAATIDDRYDVQVDTDRQYRFPILLTNRKTMAASYQRMKWAATHFGDRMGWTTTQLRADYNALLINPEALKDFYKDDAELCAYLRSIDQLRNHLHGLSQAEQAVMIELIQGLVFEACDHINTQLYHDSVCTTLSNADLQKVGTAKMRALGDALEEKGVHIRHCDDGEIRVVIDLPRGSTRLGNWVRAWAAVEGALCTGAAIGSGTMAVITSETGVGAIYFGAEAVYFTDHAYAAFKAAWSGISQDTLFVDALKHFVSEQTAKRIDQGVGLVILGVAMTPYAKQFSRYIRRMYTQPSKKTPQVWRSSTSLNAAEENSAYLQLQAQGILTLDGKLSKYALGRAKLAISGEKLKHRALIRWLTKDGSSIYDWGKYSVKARLQGYSSIVKAGKRWFPGQKIRIHFYYNRVTGQIGYQVGFKVKGFVSRGFFQEGAHARGLLLKHQRLLRWQRKRAARVALLKLGFAVNQASFFSRPHRSRQTQDEDHKPAP